MLNTSLYVYSRKEKSRVDIVRELGEFLIDLRERRIIYSVCYNDS